MNRETFFFIRQLSPHLSSYLVTSFVTPMLYPLSSYHSRLDIACQIGWSLSRGSTSPNKNKLPGRIAREGGVLE